MARYGFAFILILAMALCVSCSGSDGNYFTSPDDHRESVAGQGGTMVCLGSWNVIASKDIGILEATPLRGSDNILNVLSFLEPPALTGMSIDFDTLFIDFDNGELSVDVILTHPLNDPVFMGFDVRGVVFGPKVVNSDGYTPVMAPENFAGEPFGYIDGMLGSPYSFAGYDEGIYGYRYFCDSLSANDDLPEFFTEAGNLANRGVFSNGEKRRRYYHLDWEGTDYNILVFNYAIYANFNWPVGDPPITIDDFPINSANSREAFCAEITETVNGLYYEAGIGGGTISLDVEVWDWLNDIVSVSMRSLEPGVIAETPGTYDGPGSTAYSSMYSFSNVPAVPTSPGDLDIVITVTDPVTFGEAWFLDLLSTTHPMYDVQLYNCFIHTANVAECPPPIVTGIDPDAGWAGQIVDATVTGTFIDGPSLGVRLSMTGEDDIYGTDVVMVGDDIECTFNLDGAADGDWTVVVTNGCGSEGYLADGFSVGSCEGHNECPSGSHSVANHFQNFIHYPNRGTTATRNSDTQYLICTGFKNTIEHRIIAYIPGETTFSFLSAIMGPYTSAGELPSCMAADSNDRIYYRAGDEAGRLQYIDFDGTTGFGPIDQEFGWPVPWGSIRRVAIDNDDYPHVLCYSGTTFRIYPWDGTDWGTYISVPTQIMSENGNDYRNINDFDLNPITGDYIITTYYNPPKFYAINTSGVIVFSDDDIWEAGITEAMYAGIYIDRDNPGCRFILSGTPYIAGTEPNYGEAYFARCNPLYGEWTYSTLPEGDYPFEDGLGSVVNVDGTYYFCGTTSYRWHSAYIEVPEW